MAKKVQLSLEEMLEQALVKDEDKPYEVPENWVWTRLGVVCSINPPKLISKMIPDEFEISFIPMSAISEVSGSIVSMETREICDVKNGYTNFANNDILFAKITPCMENGKSAIAMDLTNGIGYGSTEFHVLRVTKCTLSKLIYYLVRAKWFRESAKPHMTGTVGQQRVPKSYLENYTFPIPPLPEQQRIVSIIDSLFEKLDRAKELAQTALDSFENRKSAILHKAFTGELTRTWREEHGVEFKRDWEKKSFDEVATVKSNLVDPFEYKEFSHIAPDNIEKRTGRLLSYNTIGEDGVTSGKHRFYAGQILYSKIRPYLSKVVIVDFDGLCSADMYPIETKLITRYLWYYMLSDDFVMAASSAGSRSVLPKINQKELGQLRVICPPIAEQQEIVRILDHLLENEQKANELCDVIEKIDFMKKAILARAFRGELGTNNPEEESAIELLKEVLKEKLQ